MEGSYFAWCVVVRRMGETISYRTEMCQAKLHRNTFPSSIPTIRAGVVGWRKRQDLKDISLLFWNQENPLTDAGNCHHCEKNAFIIFDPCSLWLCTKGKPHTPALNRVLVNEAAGVSLWLCLKPKRLRSLHALTLALEWTASSTELL